MTFLQSHRFTASQTMCPDAFGATDGRGRDASTASASSRPPRSSSSLSAYAAKEERIAAAAERLRDLLARA